MTDTQQFLLITTAAGTLATLLSGADRRYRFLFSSATIALLAFTVFALNRSDGDSDWSATWLFWGALAVGFSIGHVLLWKVVDPVAYHLYCLRTYGHFDISRNPEHLRPKDVTEIRSGRTYRPGDHCNMRGV